MRKAAFRGRALAGSVAIACGLAGCNGRADRPAEAAAPAVTVRAVMSKDPPSLSLIGKADRNSEILAVQLTDSLVQYDEHLRLVPRVAERYEFTDDGRTLTFVLRPGVRWHDGSAVTAEDVVFTAEQVRDPAVESKSFAPQLRDVLAIEAVDARTVRVRYRTASPDALEAWRFPLLPRHQAERGAALLSGGFAKQPVGCGPFRFVSYRPGESIVLEANEDYWDGRPSIDRLVFLIYPEERTSFQALLAGDLDVMTATPDLWFEARSSPQGAHLEALSYYRLNLWAIAWRLTPSGFFGDAGVRRAMVLALDRQTFIDEVVHGLARTPATSYHPELPVWTDPEVKPLPYDPAEAKRLLAAAGWVDRDGDGTVDRDGRPFRFDLMIEDSTQRINDNLAAWLQASWSRLGVRAEIEKLEWQRFRERRKSGEFEAAMSGLSFTSNPDQFEVYHSSVGGEGFNYGGFSDPEVDRLLEAGRVTWDVTERRRIYSRLQRRLAELQPMAYLMCFQTPVLHDRRLQGIVPSLLDHWRTTRGPRVWRWMPERSGG